MDLNTVFERLGVTTAEVEAAHQTIKAIHKLTCNGHCSAADHMADIVAADISTEMKIIAGYILGRALEQLEHKIVLQDFDDDDVNDNQL